MTLLERPEPDSWPSHRRNFWYTLTKNANAIGAAATSTSPNQCIGSPGLLRVRILHAPARSPIGIARKNNVAIPNW